MSVVSLIRTRFKQASYFGLSLIFGFDRWHYHIVRENCAYFERVSEMHRCIDPHTTIEIGCGLGEIIGGLRSAERIGVDRESSVIRAARVIRSHAIRFETDDDFRRLCKSSVAAGPVCLIFLNWFHVYTAEDVRRIVRGYTVQTEASHIIFDVIDKAPSGYRFRHPPNLLAELGTIGAVEDAGDGIRSLVVMELCR